MPAEGRENPLLKKGNSDAFFREKYLTKNNGPEWPGIMAPLAGQDGHMQHVTMAQIKRCRENMPIRLY